MAQLPNDVLVLLDGYSEEFEAGVIKTEMERGLAKYRVGQSRVVMTVSVSLVFETSASATAFDDWYFSVVRRIGWFDWLDPRTNAMRTVRFKDGALGALQPMAGQFSMSKRTAALEYLR